MEIRHLRYFVTVAELCHFGRAAERLHTAQPHLSQQIKHLETELGVQLLTRSTRKVDLTPAGALYLDHARAVLARIDLAAVETRRLASGHLGRVSIGFTGSATYDVLPRFARALRKDLPGLDLDLRGEMLTPAQVVGLLDRSLDIGFLRPPVRSCDIEVRVLRREPLIVALPRSHPLAAKQCVRLADLRDEPFITYPSHQRSVVYESVITACTKAGFLPSEVHEVAETSTLVSFVAAGLGIALVPESVHHLAITGVIYRPLEEASEDVELAVAMRRGESSPQVAHVLKQALALIVPAPTPRYVWPVAQTSSP